MGERDSVNTNVWQTSRKYHFKFFLYFFLDKIIPSFVAFGHVKRL